MILDEKSMIPPPPPYDEIVHRTPATAWRSDLGQNKISLTALPSHILLQIVYSTFPETDGRFQGQSKVVMQHETLFWLETSLRLVSRSLYMISMYILRNTYLPAYLSLVKPPYTSDLTAADNPQGSALLETGNREIRTLDLFIALLAHEDFMLDSTCLHLPREEAYKDVFDLMQPRSRLEDLIFRQGTPMGLVAANDATNADGPGPSSSQRHPNPSSSVPPTPTTPTTPTKSSFNPLNVVSAYREKKKMKKIPPPTPFVSERPVEPIKPVPFSALSVSLSPRTVKVLCTDSRWKKTLVEIERSKDESLEATARRLLLGMRETMEMD